MKPDAHNGAPAMAVGRHRFLGLYPAGLEELLNPIRDDWGIDLVSLLLSREQVFPS